MAGLAKTNDFMLSTATVMLGQTSELFDLNPTDHGIGLVKNFAITTEPTYTDLTQGVKGDIVFSVMTANPTRASMEVFEYTAKNMAYALGLDGSTFAAKTASTTLSAATNASPASNTITVTSAAGFTVGSHILIEANTDDYFVTRKIVSVATNTLTLDNNVPAMPIGAKVYLVNAIDIGSKAEQPFLSAKVAGKTANGQDILIAIPKIRVTKGFNLSFVQDNYGNMPFEFTMYDMVSTDTYYSAFTGAKARIFRR